MPPRAHEILIFGTCDTKLEELKYLKEEIQKDATSIAKLVDIGHKPVQARDSRLIDLDAFQLLSQYGVKLRPDELERWEKTEYVSTVVSAATEWATRYFHENANHVMGAIGIGGSSGSAMACAIMRSAFPVGFPKLCASTIASGDTRPLVEETDITLMHSVVDIAGANEVLTSILENAAGAICGMAGARRRRMEPGRGIRRSRKKVGITMFGVTTPAVDAIRGHLEEGIDAEVFVFHATGAGGRAMERLITDGVLHGVIDLTTTEIADEVVGGIYSAGPDRLKAGARAGIPMIVSLGACDMVNFGPKDTVPKDFQKGRRLYEHNPSTTLMRTSPGECSRIAQMIATNLKEAAKTPRNIRVIIPEKGVSMLSVEGTAFYDSRADQELFRGVEGSLHGSGIQVDRDRRDINDPKFARPVADIMIRMLKSAF